MLRINEVRAGKVRGGVKAVIPSQAEVLVSNGGIPVHIGIAVLVALIPAKMQLIGILGGAGFNDVIMELVGLAVVDGAQVGFGQLDVIKLAGLENLERNVAGFDHLVGNGIEQGAVGIPVQGVLGQNLFIAVDVMGDGVAAIVPHVLVGAGIEAINAQLVYQGLGRGIEAVVGGNGGKVGQLGYAMVNQGVVIGSFDADHLLEYGQIHALGFVGGEADGLEAVLFADGFELSLGFLVILGQLFLGGGVGIRGDFKILIAGHIGIVIGGAFDHFGRHGGVGGFVLMEVQYPFKTNQPVLGLNFLHGFAVHVYPLNALAEVEGPGLAAVLGAPGFRDGGNEVAVVIVGQKAIDAVGKDAQFLVVLAIENVEGLHFVSQGEISYPILFGLFAHAQVKTAGHGRLGLSLGLAGVLVVVALRPIGVGRRVVVCACGEYAKHEAYGQQNSKQLFHCTPPYYLVF